MSKVSWKMLDVLHSIAYPQDDEEPFPHSGTVRALIKRGLVKVVKAEPESAADVIFNAMGAFALEATEDGLAVLRFHGLAE